MTERLPTSLPEVTPRQREVARLVAEGLTNEEIATRLGISLAGAKYHVSELLGRLGATHREEIAEWYRRGGADQPRRWLPWQRALIALAAGLLGAAAIMAMAVGVPAAGGSDAIWPVGGRDTELVTRAQVEALLAGLLDGGILYTRTEKYYRGGHAWGVEEQSIRLPDRYVYHSWQIYDDDGRLLHAVGAAVGEDGATYERFFRSSHERFDARELPTAGYLNVNRWNGLQPEVGPLDVLKDLDERGAGLRDAVAAGEADAQVDEGRITVVLHNPSYPCGLTVFPVDLFPLRIGVREERDAEESTYVSLRSACWVDLQDGSEVLLASTSTTYEALDSSEWDAIVDRMWPDGVPTPKDSR